MSDATPDTPERKQARISTEPPTVHEINTIDSPTTVLLLPDINKLVSFHGNKLFAISKKSLKNDTIEKTTRAKYIPKSVQKNFQIGVSERAKMIQQ
jgi:hypothetical protein